jgi:glycosyltransferase involved in cell wall biosynthesis
MKKVKIFVDGHWFDEPFQSTGVFIKGLYQQLAYDERFEIFLGAYSLAALEKEFEGTEFKFLPYSSHSKYKRLSVDVTKLIQKHRFDFIHFQYTLPLIKTCKEIVTIHDVLFMEFPELFPWSYRISKEILFKRSAKRAEIVTTVSGYSKTAITRYFHIPGERIHIIPNGISASFYNPEQKLDDSLRKKYSLDKFILYVSRIEPRKNHITLVKAFVQGEFWKRGFQLVFIGKQDIEVPELNEYINSLSERITKSIIFLTGVEESALKDLYLNTCLFVYPSIAEGFGIPPLEAAVMKAKVLCSNATAMSDFSFFNEDLIRVNDVDVLIAEMNRTLSADNAYKREQIAHLVKEKYCWKTIAEDFVRLIFRHHRANG